MCGVVMLVLAVMTMPKGVKAAQLWHVKMGAESRDMSRQAMAFLPTEMDLCRRQRRGRRERTQIIR
jgi:hypothetical protein